MPTEVIFANGEIMVAINFPEFAVDYVEVFIGEELRYRFISSSSSKLARTERKLDLRSSPRVMRPDHEELTQKKIRATTVVT